MRRCPECLRDYTDDSLSFCLDDGERLLDGPRTDETLRHVFSEMPTRSFDLPITGENTGRTTGASVSRQRGKLWIYVAAVFLLLGTGIIGYRFFLVPTGKQIESIAILPISNETGNADFDYLCDGLTETLINRMSKLPNLKVIARSSAYHYKGRNPSPQEAANELKVRAIMTGRVVQRGQNLEISVEITDVPNNTQLWGERFVRKVSDLVAIQEDIGQIVSGALRIKLTGSESPTFAKKYTNSDEAYQLYLKGRYQWNKRTGESLMRAVEFYKQALIEDPDFALAYAGMAESYVIYPIFGVAPPKDIMPLAKATATKALEIDESLAEAHAALGLYHGFYAWDLAAAERELRRAIEINPNYATAHHWLGNLLTVLKRFDEGIAQIRQAESLDPLSPIIRSDIGTNLIIAHRYDEAIVQLNRALALDPNFPFAIAALGDAYAAKGLFSEAVVEYRKATLLDNSTQTRGMLAAALAKSGERAEALTILNELKSESHRRFVSNHTIAIVCAALGQRDEAFASLEKDINERTLNPPSYQSDPKLDGVRDDPRFTDLIERISKAPTE